MVIKCSVCKHTIVKYEMDLGNTISLKFHGVTSYICNDCGKEILKQFGERL